MPTVPGLAARALLFTDIEGSTSLLRRLGDGYPGVLERHYAIIRSAMTARSGIEQSREGDSLFVTFPSATAALETAVEAQCRLEREPWPPDGRVRVRMGLHVGEVAETDAGLVGLAIHQAARIMSAGHGGQIVVSGDVVHQAARLPQQASVRSLGIHELRDVGRVSLFQVEHPELQREFPGLRTKRAMANNLPRPPTSLVGRDSEAGAVSALLKGNRLVTLLGEGGCGKTRLALRVAVAELDQFTDGVWFVDLTPLSAGVDVDSRLAEVFGVQGGMDEVLAALEQRHVLLLLDNCEHVLESTSTLVSRLLSACPHTSVIATSRAPLELAGEVRYHVPGLEVPRPGDGAGDGQATEAVQLFTARARLVRPSFQPDEREMAAIVDLCARLEGLPLGIELAAARLRGMTVDELVGRMDDRLGVLVGGPRSVPARHQTLRNTMEWSFALLDDDELHVVRQLATFRGGCDAESAEAVCAAQVTSPGGVLDVVLRLVDKSLVTPVEVEATTRYRIHETVREFALSSVSESERHVIHERHTRWFGALASRLGEGPSPGGERAWIHRHDIERDNFRAAVEWLLGEDPPAALRVLIDIEPGMDLTAQKGWWPDLLRRVLRSADTAPAADRAHAVSLLAWQESENGDDSALALVAEAQLLIQDVDDPVVECTVLSAVAKCNADVAGGELDEGLVAAAVAAADRAGGTYWPVMIRCFLSWRAPLTIAETLNTDALLLAERQGLELFAALARSNLATVAQFRGDGAAALAAWRAVVPLLDDLVIHEADNASLYALAEGEHGTLGMGVHLADDFLLRLTRLPHDPHLDACLCSVAAHLRRLNGDLDGAEAALERAERVGPPTFNFLGGLAIITRSALHRQRGDPQAAAIAIERAHRHLGFGTMLTDIEMRVIEELAAVAYALGRNADGSALLATARASRQREHKPLSPNCRREVDDLHASVAEIDAAVLSTAQVVALAESLAAGPYDEV